LNVADLFARARDYENALAQYQTVLKLDRKNAAALAGAGEAAFQMGHYKTAQKLLQSAIEEDPKNETARERLHTATLVLETDPFLPRIPDAERNRRIAVALAQAGDRLKACAPSKSIVPSNISGRNNDTTSSTGDNSTSLWARWQAARTDVHRLNSKSNPDLPDALMDLVLQIEQQTAQQCGEPSGVDLALLLFARGRETVDQ
jgi:tetratricopeptide (TPR) repeat protein